VGRKARFTPAMLTEVGSTAMASTIIFSTRSSGPGQRVGVLFAGSSLDSAHRARLRCAWSRRGKSSWSARPGGRPLCSGNGQRKRTGRRTGLQRTRSESRFSTNCLRFSPVSGLSRRIDRIHVLEAEVGFSRLHGRDVPVRVGGLSFLRVET